MYQILSYSTTGEAAQQYSLSFKFISNMYWGKSANNTPESLKNVLKMIVISEEERFYEFKEIILASRQLHVQS